MKKILLQCIMAVNYSSSFSENKAQKCGYDIMHVGYVAMAMLALKGSLLTGALIDSMQSKHIFTQFIELHRSRLCMKVEIL